MSNSEVAAPARTLSWKQGFSISLGVPVLILPMISTFSGYLGAFAIIIWLFSNIQGFAQNFAYGELASKYPNVSGLPGFAQAVFKSKKGGKEYGFSKFVGAFSAWGYWFAWNPVLAVFSLTIGGYLQGIVPALANVPLVVISAGAGLVIFALLILINLKGLTGGALLGYILASLSLIPLVVISLAVFFTGDFDFGRIVNDFMPSTYTWDFNGGILFFGILAMAQWCACGWETAAIYAPLYKNPRKDIPKALFACGIVCIVTYLLVQTACAGSLGMAGIAQNFSDPMRAMAELTMGKIGGIVAAIMLIAAMVLIIQTAMLGASSAMSGMADEGNLPKFFGKKNKHDVPVVAMITISILNFGLIWLGTPGSILAASSLGYVVANGISLFAYVKSARDWKTNPNPSIDYYKAPKGWKTVALIFGILNLPLYFIGLMMINTVSYEWYNAVIGVVILFLFIPLWFYCKKVNTAKSSASQSSNQPKKEAS